MHASARRLNSTRLIIVALTFISTTLLCGCFLIVHQFKDTEGTNKKSKFNADNKIYLTNRTFLFRSILISKADTIRNEYVALKILPGHWFHQTKMKWKYYKSLSDTNYYDSEISGLVETPSRIWFHPPRQNKYEVTETMPFPSVKIPIQKSGRRFEGTFLVGGAWGDSIKGGFSLYSTYMGDDVYTSSMGTMQVEKLKLESVNKRDSLKRSTAIVYYNPTYGVVKMDCVGYFGDQLYLALERVKDE